MLISDLTHHQLFTFCLIKLYIYEKEKERMTVQVCPTIIFQSQFLSPKCVLIIRVMQFIITGVNVWTQNNLLHLSVYIIEIYERGYLEETAKKD